jgi:hypothetical protein
MSRCTKDIQGWHSGILVDSNINMSGFFLIG